MIIIVCLPPKTGAYLAFLQGVTQFSYTGIKFIYTGIQNAHVCDIQKCREKIILSKSVKYVK